MGYEHIIMGMLVLSIVLLVAVLVVSILNLTKECKTSTKEGYNPNNYCESCCKQMEACRFDSSSDACTDGSQCEKDKQTLGCTDCTAPWTGPG